MKKKKNLWIIPTDKPSKLWVNSLKRRYELENEPLINSNATVHIYITSDENIKIGDWIFYTSAIGFCKTTISSKGLKQEGIPAKKIILTTDQDLIADGVQAIDDEFLEWFVKNPSCEWVEVENEKVHVGWEPDYSYEHLGIDGSKNVYHNFYNIIIPQEEPKQETI